MCAKKFARVLLVYDKAGIDLKFWNRCRQECALYFLSRLKENMVMEWVEDGPLDRKDPRNHGVLHDWKVRSRDGQLLRVVTYQEPVSGEVFEFLTNQLDLPAGVIVELYRRRWEVEKVFDQLKNKLGHEPRGAGNAGTDDRPHAQPDVGLRRGTRRTAPGQQRAGGPAASPTAGIDAAPMLPGADAAFAVAIAGAESPQRSVKFIRWLRQSLRDGLAEGIAVVRLKALYTRL